MIDTPISIGLTFFGFAFIIYMQYRAMKWVKFTKRKFTKKEIVLLGVQVFAIAFFYVGFGLRSYFIIKGWL